MTHAAGEVRSVKRYANQTRLEKLSSAFFLARPRISANCRRRGSRLPDRAWPCALTSNVAYGSWPVQNALPAWAVPRRIAFSALTMLGSRP